MMISFIKKIFGKTTETKIESIIEAQNKLHKDLNEIKKVHAKVGSFDETFFFNEETMQFKFPKYKTSQSLVKIKDYTNYRSDYWSDYSKDEKANYTINQFESDFFGVDIEIEPFWNIFNKLSKTQLEPFGFLKRRGKDLQDFLFENEDEINDEQPYLFLDNEFKEKLFKVNCFDIVSFSTDTEKQNYICNAEDQIKTTTLRELAKKNKLKSSLKRDDLIEQFHLNNIDINLPKPILTNNNFEKMLLKFAKLYIEDIKNSINEWHPLYFDEIWEMVANESEFELVEQMAKEIIAIKYWKDRFV